MDLSNLIPYIPAIAGGLGYLGRQLFAMLNRKAKNDPDKPVYFDVKDTILKTLVGGLGAASTIGLSGIVCTDVIICGGSAFFAGFALTNMLEKGWSILLNVGRNIKTKFVKEE